MTVERRAVRCYFRDELRGRTHAGDAVKAGRKEPIMPERELQAGEVAASLLVYTLSDTPTIDTDAPRFYTRRLELAVELFAVMGPDLDAEDLEDLIDELSDQVECVIEPRIPQLARLRLADGTTLGVNPSKSGLERVEIDFDARGFQLAGAARLVFAVHYFTDVDEREQARATDLERMRAVYRFPPAAADSPPAAEDEIDDLDG